MSTDGASGCSEEDSWVHLEEWSWGTPADSEMGECSGKAPMIGGVPVADWTRACELLFLVDSNPAQTEMEWCTAANPGHCECTAASAPPGLQLAFPSSAGGGI